ncbi:MAG: hypothetical protein J7623_16570 [Chitinophaga sp.]|uniref:hypothetical protein n=1 Tax=Chitinophaga sp. TaxID=1869181 RepID=UPI001B10431B|nr:hypothetical protein [Chitinophaga sp.]MBO9730256.1 hypothetical protein [Chitinophaga sp.]
MKANIYFFLLLLTSTVFISCKKDTIAYQKDFNRSYDAWAGFKAASGNSYRYTVSSASWTGFSTETTITVKEGKVVQRAYIAKAVDRTNPPIRIVEEWTENAAQLGSHANGYALRTLDDIYREAKDDWLQKRGNVKTYFEATNNGMISSCGYVENGCMDDCFRGITIRSIEKI